MNALFVKKLLQHVAVVVSFLIIAIIYCQPALKGKVVNQHDTQGWQGMAQQSFEFKEKYGHLPYWTNSMFSGMPAYQIAMEYDNKISINYFHSLFTLGLPKPINFFFLACVMAYFLFVVLKLHPWVGIIGALAYAYSTYDPIIVAVGHDTKMICIAYAPAVLASLFLIFQKKYLAGTALTALFVALMFSFNHIQIIYYTLLMALAVALAFAIQCYKNKDWKHLVISGALSLLAGGIALGVNTASLWSTNEYVKETMRGGRSELTDTTNQSNKSKGGLDKDYAFLWSYGINESFTMLVPGIYGGGSSGNQISAEGSKFAAKLAEIGMPEESAVQYANAYAYWGDQPSTAGPVYLGAVICFLFVLGMIYVKHWAKWGIFGACVFGILLAWGKNAQGINYFLFDYLPLYNKFRAPSMALVIPQLGFVVIACMAAQEIFFGQTNREELWKKFRLAGYITLGVFALLAIMYVSFSYTGKNDAAIRQNFSSGMLQQLSNGQQPSPQMQQQATDFARSIMSGLQQDRQGLFGKDLIRSLVYILLAAGAIWLYIKDKLKPVIALTAMGLLCTLDITSVGKRYLNNDSFVEPTEFESVFTLTPADQQIKSDPGYFRVFDQTASSPFESSTASYHHNSIGGYSPAKLALYQDLIQRQLSTGNMHVYNMLNAKYFITANPTTGQPQAQQNPGALGNAWFVKNVRFAKNADEEMNMLATLNTKDSAVMDMRFREMAGPPPAFDSLATIKLIENRNDRISYESSAGSNQFAVFSEIYYPHGWNAYIDGKPTTYVRVNYALRGMPVPSGKHTIEFRFEPRSVILGDKITMCFSILVYLMVIAALAFLVREKPWSNTTVNPKLAK